MRGWMLAGVLAIATTAAAQATQVIPPAPSQTAAGIAATQALQQQSYYLQLLAEQALRARALGCTWGDYSSPGCALAQPDDSDE